MVTHCSCHATVVKHCVKYFCNIYLLCYSKQLHVFSQSEGGLQLNFVIEHLVFMLFDTFAACASICCKVIGHF